MAFVPSSFSSLTTTATTVATAALIVSLLLSSHPFTPFAAAVTDDDALQWLVPSAGTSWNNGDSVTLSWGALNSSICDLWLSDVNSSSDYSVRLGSNINLNLAGTLPWAIDIGTEQLAVSELYELFFVPTGQAYNSSSAADQLQFASPTFTVLPQGSSSAFSEEGAENNITTTTTTASSSATSSAVSSSTTTAFPSPKGGTGPTTAVKAGTAVAAVVALGLIVGLLFWVFRLRRRVKQVENLDDERKGILPSSSSATDLDQPPSSPSSPMVLLPPAAAHLTESSDAKRRTLPGLHEMKADTRQPQEMSVEPSRHSIYEMPA